MAVKLTQYLRQCDGDPDVGWSLLPAPEIHSVGLDLNMRERGERRTRGDTGSPFNECCALIHFKFPPVIAQLMGQQAIGAAYPLTCDICSEANIAFSFVKWGFPGNGHHLTKTGWHREDFRLVSLAARYRAVKLHMGLVLRGNSRNSWMKHALAAEIAEGSSPTAVCSKTHDLGRCRTRANCIEPFMRRRCHSMGHSRT